MAVSKSILATMVGLLSLFPAAAALPTTSSHCDVEANFTLIADAPGTEIDGRSVAANKYDYYLTVSPKNKTVAEGFNFVPATFSKMASQKDKLYMYLGSTDPNADGLPYYDGNFTTAIQLFPPEGHIDFHPGVLKNPDGFGPYPASIGGFFACGDSIYETEAQDFYVNLGTYAFQTSQFYPNPSLGCIAFKPKIELQSVGLKCDL